MSPLRARLAELIDRGAALSPHARSALLLRKGLLTLILDSNGGLARAAFAEGEVVGTDPVPQPPMPSSLRIGWPMCDEPP